MCKSQILVLPCIVISLVFLTLVSSCDTPAPTVVSPSPVPATLAPFGEIIADSAPARLGPGDGYDKAGDFSRGDMMELIQTEGEWIKVRSDNFDADVWIYARFVRQIPSLPPSPTLQATQASTLPPSPTAIPQAMTQTPEPEVICDPPPAAWVVYTIQPGDTIYSLARTTDTTVEMLAQVNCMQDVTKIYSGQKLYVPKLPPTPTLPLPPSPTSTPRPICTPSSTPTPTVPPLPSSTSTPTGTPIMTPTPSSTSP